MMDEGGGGGGDVDEEKEKEYKTRRGEQLSAGDRGRAGMVGRSAESGVRATCSVTLQTIVYRHRSTEWPVPYTDSHTPGAHEVIERVKELLFFEQEERGRKEERKGKRQRKGDEREYNR